MILKNKEITTEYLYCPRCDERWSTFEIFPLDDGVDVAQCTKCNTILEKEDWEAPVREEVRAFVKRWMLWRGLN